MSKVPSGSNPNPDSRNPNSPKSKRASSPAPKSDASVTKAVEEEKPKSGFFTPVKIAIIVGVVVLGYVLKTTVLAKVSMKELLEQAVTFIEKSGQTAVIWYCLFVLVGVVCLCPTTPIELAGGFLFSPKYGMWTVLCFTGGTKLVANVISVLIARHLLKDWVMTTIVEKNAMLKMVSEAVKEEPWKMAFLVRGSMAPLAVKNYGLGVMEIPYAPIAAFSMVFTNFYAFQNIYLGASLQDIKEVFAPKKAADGPVGWDTTAKKMMPVVFNILLIIFLVKAVKQQVAKQAKKIEEETKHKADKKQ